MLNKTETTEIEKLYLQHQRYIEHLTQEAINIKDKYGSKSKLYESKIKSIQFLTHFHDHTINAFNQLEKAFMKLQMNYYLLETFDVSRTCNISIDKASEVLGNKDHFKNLVKIANIDEIDNRITTRVKSFMEYEQKQSDGLIDLLTS
jgi:hypothetical protein